MVAASEAQANRMSTSAKLLFGAMMSVALMFGFLHSEWPEAAISFKRLHIFLFNLVSGGSLILYYSVGRRFDLRVRLYFAIAVAYALAAAARWYVPALVLSVPLAALVESVRIARFGALPLDFFRPGVPVDRKFNQASLLCLSIGILFASAVMLNNEYLHWVAYQKLQLDVFFLGYSFPISLITMSVMFSFMRGRGGRLARGLKEAAFWLVNLGVITFFAFIIFELLIPEVIISSTLFVTVCVIFGLFTSIAPRVQQKAFLTSGMAFLLCTGLTGVFYILKYYLPSLEGYAVLTLDLHAMVALYGWNLSGLFIIMRWSDFPIRMSTAVPIALHWAIVLVLAPLSKYVLPVAIATVPAYMLLLILVLSTRRVADGGAE
jgi:hypothetical protein